MPLKAVYDPLLGLLKLTDTSARVAVGTIGGTTDFSATAASDFTATLTTDRSMTLSGFTARNTRIAIQLTVSGGGAPTLSIPVACTIMTTQTLSILADGIYVIVFETFDSGTTYHVYVALQP